MKMLLTFSVLLSSFIGSHAAFAQSGSDNKANLIAVGQGVSSPTSTSTVNFSTGYTNEHPVGVVYQNSWRLTGEADHDSDENDGEGNGNDGYGAEVGYGNGSAGLAAGYYTRDCDNCEGRFAGSGGVVISDSVGVGLRFEEDLYTAGLLFNPNGTHRFGALLEMNDSGGDGNEVKSYGAGYSYVSSGWTFSLDASKNDYENQATYSDRIIITPGVMVRAGFLQLSLNDNITLNNRENGTSNEDETDHNFWAGLGIGGDKFHLAVYANYKNDFSGALSYFF